MNKLIRQIKEILAPIWFAVVFAVIGGLIVAFISGVLDFDQIKDWFGGSSSIVSPAADQGETGKPVEKEEPASKSTSQADSDSDFVAVFLTNSQIYFGKLDKTDSQNPILTDVFYLRVQRNLQPPESSDSDDEAGVAKAQVATTDFKLIKFGNELHGPTDQMELNRDYILFWEPLESDSKVVQAIEAFKTQE